MHCRHDAVVVGWCVAVVGCRGVVIVVGGRSWDSGCGAYERGGDWLVFFWEMGIER